MDYDYAALVIQNAWLTSLVRRRQAVPAVYDEDEVEFDMDDVYPPIPIDWEGIREVMDEYYY